MGVRGLTTYIARNSEHCLQNYELHDTYLVVDGNNIASQLYKWYGKSNDCFGGDYDKYSKSIYRFYQILAQCKITPLVIFDGGYEDKKLKTLFGRIRSRIKSARKLNTVTEWSVSVFPLFIREVFVDITLKLGVKLVRCDFEADREMACLAHSLNCPLLSYDSDFFIFDVLYVPFSTFDMNVTKGDYNYVQCRLYKVELFLERFGTFDKTNLPLLAVLSGNDYIKRSVFDNFYSQLKQEKQLKTSHERIALLIKWLQHETYDSAIKKVLERLKMKERDFVAKQIRYFTNEYICEDSYLMKYLNIKNCANKDENSFFTEKYRKCLYPCCFMDIISKNAYFCVPQLEDYTSVSSHEISLHLLSVMQKILLPTSSVGLICMTRTETGKLCKKTLPLCTDKLPTLSELSSLTKSLSKALLLKIVDVNEEILRHFPDSWKIFIVSIIYWFDNSKVYKCQLYSLLLCAIILTNQQTDFGGLLKDFSNKRCLQAKSRLKSYFGIDPKMRSNVKLYDINNLDTFAQFQSVLLHIKYLNSLLNEPFGGFFISEFYNGTFIYNVCTNFAKRNDLDAYVRIFLKDDPGVCTLFFRIVDVLKEKIDLDRNVSSSGRRRRRRKKRVVETPSQIMDVEILSNDDDESDGSGSCDINNRFNLLKLIN